MMLELTIRTLCDIPANAPADAAYLFSQTPDNEQSVFSAACQLMEKQRVRRILIAQCGPKSGYPGYLTWKEKLLATGLSEDRIMGVDLSQSEILHTRIEAVGMIAHAKKWGYSQVYVVAPPFHQVRAFMTAVTIALADYPDIGLYSYHGHPVSWLASVAHSQGKTLGPRKSLIQGEMDRIRAYQKKGDLASASDVLGYLNRRDGANP